MWCIVNLIREIFINDKQNKETAYYYFKTIIDKFLCRKFKQREDMEFIKTFASFIENLQILLMQKNATKSTIY